MSKTKKSLFIVLFLAALSNLCSIFAQTTEVVVFEGESIPDGTATFRSFDVPFINNLGQVAYTGFLLDPKGDFSCGIFLTGSETSIQIVRVGDPEPNGNGPFSFVECTPITNDSGQVVFEATITDEFLSGLFFGDGNSIGSIAIEGDPVQNGNGVFDFISGLRINREGTIVFRASLTDTKGGNLDDSGIFYYENGLINEIVRKGDFVPGTDFIFSSTIFPSELNDAGTFLFRADTTDGVSDVQRLMVASKDKLRELIKVGDPTPEGDVLAVLGGASHNNSESVVFGATLLNGMEGYFRIENDVITTVVRNGESVPDGDGTFENLLGFGINNAGGIAFVATVSNAEGSEAEAIFIQDGDTRIEAVRVGDTTPDGMHEIGEISNFEFNESGQIAFRDNFSLYFFDQATGLLPVVQPDDILNGSPVFDICVLSGFLNDFGQVAFDFFLDDTNQGIAVWSPPTSAIIGDLNGDRVVNGLDIPLFVDLIISKGYSPNGDINMDGFINLLDVSPFVELL